eukprot:GFUD01000023.1.p1 GENE.GFUD01000023.1~~GFUD01000023.1.p1  ORF type:complete len:2308 (+),score=442.37 GFUD01000023.1:211-7134(+)
MDDSNTDPSDPNYLPPDEAELSPSQSVSDSPPGDFSRRGHRERSITPFLRSQGRADGHGLAFNSRISPSPNRSFHRRRRRRHHSQESSLSATESESETHEHKTHTVEFQVPAKKASRRNLTNEMQTQSLHQEDGAVNTDFVKSGRDQVDRSERSDRKRSSKHRVTEMDLSGHHSVTSKYSNSVSTHGERTHRVRKYEEETVDRKVTIRTRDKVMSRTSDYSSQSASDTEKDIFTSTPKDNMRVPAKVSSRRDSPRLKAFEGDDWIHSPRTGYTYASSLTYRDKVTPGRDVPMPHMTRLPLDGYQGLARTELWEQSEIEVRNERLRTLAEYSEDESSPPHRIYKRGAAIQETRKSSNLFYQFVYLVFLPLTCTYSLTRHLLRNIIYDLPAYMHKVDISLLIKSDKAKGKSQNGEILASVWTRITSLFYWLFYAVYFIISLPKTAANASTDYLNTYKSTSSKEVEITPSKTDLSDLISEDEDESGLTNFVSAQKHIYSFKDHLEDEEKNSAAEEYESILVKVSHFVKYFTNVMLLPFYSISNLWIDFLDNISETSSEKSDFNDQDIFEEETGSIEIVTPGGKSMLSKTVKYFRRILFSFVNSIGPSVSGNYLITENIKSPKRVIFKDMPEMPETGAFSPFIIKDDYKENLNEAPPDSNFQEDADNVKQYHIIPEGEELQLNSFYDENLVEEDLQQNSVQSFAISERFSLMGIISSPFFLVRTFVGNMWAKIFYSEPELRRSRRLRGLNPEEKALQEKQRQKQRRELNIGNSFLSENQEEDGLNKKVSGDGGQSSLKIEQRVRKKGKTIKKNKSILEWFVSLFYKKRPLRRSRRLRGLGPEEIEMMEKRKRGQRNQSKGISENVLEIDNTDMEDDDDGEDSELIFFAYFHAIYDYVHQLFKVRKDTEEDKDMMKDTSSESFSKNILEKDGTKLKKVGLIYSIGNFLYSIIFKKQVRRSRRLKGLEPENEGYSHNKSSQLHKLRSMGAIADENNKSVNFEKEDMVEEYDEFILYTFLKYLSSYSTLFGSGDTQEDIPENTQIPSSLNVAVNEELKTKRKIQTVGLFYSINNFIYSLFFKKRVRQSRRLRGLGAENGGFIENGQRRKLRSMGTLEDDIDESLNVEDEGNDEEYDEFIFYTWLKSLLSGFSGIFLSSKEADLSIQNLKKHNMKIDSQTGKNNHNSNKESRYSVTTWLTDQSGSMAYEKESYKNGQEAATMADLSFEEDALEAKANFDSNGTNKISNGTEYTQKAKNIFSFLFLEFIPSWTTSWFWNIYSTRKSRRQRELEPIEVKALNMWKSKTLENDTDQIPVSTQYKDEDEDEKTAFPFCCLMLLPLILGLLFLLCFLHPTACHSTLQPLSQVPEATSHLIHVIKNTTINAFGDSGSYIVSNAKSLTQSCVEGVTSIFSYLISSGSGLSAVFSDLVDSLSGLFGSVLAGASILFNGIFSIFTESLSGIWLVMQDIFNSLSGIPTLIWSQLNYLGDAVIRVFTSFTQNFGISTIPSNILSGLTSLLSSTSDLLKWVFFSSVDGVYMTAYSLGNVIMDIGGNISSVVTSSLSFVGNKTGGALESMSNSLSGGVWGLTTVASDGFGYFGKQLGGLAQVINESAVAGMSSIFGGAVYGFNYIATGIKNIFHWSEIDNIGLQIWTSLSNLPSGVVNALSGVSSNTAEAAKSGFEFVGSSFSSMFAALGTFDIFLPIKWMWINTLTFFQSLFEYVLSFGISAGTSFTDLTTRFFASFLDGSGDFFTLCKASSLSSLEAVGQLGKDSAFYVASLPYTAITGFAGYGTEAVSSLGSGLSYFIFQSGYMVTSAWERTSNYFRPKQQSPSQEATINYELLIEKVLNSDKFLNAVSKIANTKVDTESAKFKEQLTTMMNAEKLAQEKESIIVEQYKSRIDGIKVEVSDEIKKMTEDFVISNIKTAEAQATEQEKIITSLKDKYQQMLLEAEMTKQGINTHTEVIEKSNLEMQKQIEDLKTQINNLESEQKALNLTMTGCCKNITAIEITVEHYINDLLQNIIENKPDNEGKPTENFAAWVNTYFIAKSEIETKLTALTADIETKIQHHMDTEMRDVAKSEAQQTAQQIMDTVSSTIRMEYAQRIKEAQENNTEAPVEGLSKEEVFKIVKSALIQYDADKTGMFDYALETAGGSVVSTRCTETYIQKTAMYSIFGIPIWYPSNNPRTIIQPGVQPGECWAFKGSSGFVVVQLSERIVPTKFSMEHISKSMSPSGKIDSAPKDFVVYGLRFEKDTDPVKLGKYSYSQEQDPLQFFEVMFPSKEAFPYIELDIISNHGNMNYTCLYRFRVHGVLP